MKKAIVVFSLQSLFIPCSFLSPYLYRAFAADQAVNINITGVQEGGYNIGATVRPSRQPRVLMDSSVANDLASGQTSNASGGESNKKAPQKPSTAGSRGAGSGSSLTNSLMKKALDESDHHRQGSSGSSGGSITAEDLKKDFLGDLAISTATHEDYMHYLEGYSDRVKDFMRAALENELPIAEVQSLINNMQRMMADEARRRQDEELEQALANAFGALDTTTEDAIKNAIKDSPDPPKPPIDPTAPLDDQRRDAVNNDDYNHLAHLARQGTGGNLRKERDHFAEAMNAAANVAGSENATPEQRAAARQFAQNLAGYFHSLGGRTSDDPLFTDSCNILSATCDNIAHWKDPPW